LEAEQAVWRFETDSCILFEVFLDAVRGAMTKVISRVVLLLLLVYSNGAYSQSGSAEITFHVPDAGEFSVGFQLLEVEDYSRTVTGGSLPAVNYPRPIRVYVWYPAAPSEQEITIRFGRYAELADDDIWSADIVGGLHEKLSYSRRALARSLDKEQYEALLQQQLTAVEGSTPLEGPFPLVVIGQGVYYESPIVFAALAEYLAGRGFVVVTSPLVGTNSPIVTVDEVGLETQVRDLEFVIAHARRFPYVSQDKLGVFGFDMGGMAGLILTMRNNDVDAFASVSSGILYPHPAGIPMASPDYDPLALRSPWLHSVPSSWTKSSDSSGDESLFAAAHQSERYLLLTEGMGHVDYTGYALIEGRPAMVEYWEAAKPGDIDRYLTVSNYIATFFTAYLKDDSDSMAFLSENRLESVQGSKMTLEHRPAETATITYEEFVQAVILGQADSAIGRVRDIKETQPNHILLDEEYLNRIIFSLRGTWGLEREILPVLEFIVELYPTSANALYMLGEGQIALGEYSAAINFYERLLVLDPDDKRNYIKPRLEWLQSR